MNSHSPRESDKSSTQPQPKADDVIPPLSSDHAAQPTFEVSVPVEGNRVPLSPIQCSFPVSVDSTGNIEITASPETTGPNPPLNQKGATAESLAAASTQPESKADDVIPPLSSDYAARSANDEFGSAEGSLTRSSSIMHEGSPVSVTSTSNIETTAIPETTGKNQPLSRRGVTAETLAANGIHRPDVKELVDKYGFNDGPGFIIPYYDRKGNPIIDGDRPYTRCRVDTPVEKPDKNGKLKARKYLQRFRTSLHIYVPKGFDSNYHDSLVIVEGEIKALSLVEAGIPTLAIGGFWSFQNNHILIPELAEILQAFKPNRLLYLGDNDTSHNVDFSRAAVRMAKLVYPVWVVLPRIPLDQAKGIDDVRHELGSDFLSFWQKIVKTSVLVAPSTDEVRLAVFLLEREIDKIASFPKTKRDELLPRFEKIRQFTTAAGYKEKFQELFARAGFKRSSLNATQNLP